MTKAKVSNVRTAAHAAPQPSAAQNVGIGATFGGPTETTVVDPRGRSIRVKKLTAVDRMRLSLIVGNEASENRTFMMYATLACSVLSISGEDVDLLNSRRQLEMLVSKLDEDGLQAVVRGMQEAGWLEAEPEAAGTSKAETHVKN